MPYLRMAPSYGNCQQWTGILVMMMVLTPSGVTGSTPMRLVNGYNSDQMYTGRLEVFSSVNGTWGTVCNRLFNDITAGVICRILGFSFGKSVPYYEFGRGNGPIWLTEVVCAGGENDISECSHSKWGVQNCKHNWDVGLVCWMAHFWKSTGTPIRLADGLGNNRSLSGRLEVFYNNTWGTVCEDSFNLRTARVICNFLGYSFGERVLNANFGTGNGQIWLDELICAGGETDISECSHNNWGVNNCGHWKDIRLICSQTPLESNGTSLRLVNGSGDENSLSGRLEVFHNNTWGTVCGNSFTPLTASVICNLLGYSFGGNVSNMGFGAGNGHVWLDDVVCSGGETDISECSHNHWGETNCTHSEDVGLDCWEPPSNSPVTPLRLVDDFAYNDTLSGRLEVLYNNTWGTVCDDSFSDSTATVICKILGYSFGKSVSDAAFGVGSGQIWLDDVVCAGWETDVSQCSKRGWGVNDCSHAEDVGIICFKHVQSSTVKTLNAGIPLRLVNDEGYNNTFIGRLEVFYNNTWGTVCDDSFNDHTATLMCKILGFRFGRSVPSAEFGAGKGTIWLDDVVCSGWEADISECTHENWGVSNCGHGEDVGLVCWRSPFMKSSGTGVRLADGFGDNYNLSGRLEVFYNDTWGTVCDGSFSSSSTEVICNLLGYSSGYKVANGMFGDGDRPIWQNYVSCSGWVADVSQCFHNKWGVNNCNHNQDVGLVCRKPELESSGTPVRLVGGFGNNHTLSGRLEVFHNDIWGTVCGDSFTHSTARIICNFLGFSSGYAVWNSIFGSGNGPIWLDEVVCSGRETDIAQCSHNKWRVHNCGHGEDVGLVCLDPPLGSPGSFVARAAPSITASVATETAAVKTSSDIRIVNKNQASGLKNDSNDNVSSPQGDGNGESAVIDETSQKRYLWLKAGEEIARILKLHRNEEFHCHIDKPGPVLRLGMRTLAIDETQRQKTFT